ncbi:MAG: UDP-N-acetylmuramate dehydrogenase [Clostridia bacterium]|nr:UDP-N-acetylmuramate dehydrogenase [Clostridia bacterium]MDD4047270.1 UDP-N-acetylmuramate dehydrogenase [Clostridia bacterium]
MEICDFYQLLVKNGSKNVFLDEPMKQHTSWRIGGPADIFYRPDSIEECSEVIKLARINQIPITFFGAGTNVLVSDEGIRGLIIQTEGLCEIIWGEVCVTAGTGVLLAHLSRIAAEKGLSGLEFAVGIPGSLGGATLMNAGAYGYSLGDSITSVRTLNLEGSINIYYKDDLNWSYRESIFKKKKELIVEVVLCLKPGNKTQIKEMMSKYLLCRKEKQPLDLPNSGSVFKNTSQGAGRLIEEVGAKGWRVGDAQVSTKHANFIVNLGNAKAEDICALVKKVQEAVKKQYGIELETEVVFLGF